jgi:hypothetical protein
MKGRNFINPSSKLNTSGTHWESGALEVYAICANFVSNREWIFPVAGLEFNIMKNTESHTGEPTKVAIHCGFES